MVPQRKKNRRNEAKRMGRTAEAVRLFCLLAPENGEAIILLIG